MTLNDLKGLQMTLCMSNRLSEVIWSHLRSFGAFTIISFAVLKCDECLSFQLPFELPDEIPVQLHLELEVN